MRDWPPSPEERLKNADGVTSLWHLRSSGPLACSLPTGDRAGKVHVVEYEWGTDPERVLASANIAADDSADAPDYDVVICADCVYAGTSVEPLLASLCQVMCDPFVPRIRGSRFTLQWRVMLVVVRHTAAPPSRHTSLGHNRRYQFHHRPDNVVARLR